jgi:hypothetical protein
VKALSEELENPMNVHRWRKLEGSDPKRHELVQKIQTLQKRLISKTGTRSLRVAGSAFDDLSRSRRSCFDRFL